MDNTVNLLVIDDDDVVAEMVELAMRKVPGSYRVVAACDGLEALRILRGQSDHKVSPPLIILLDINMPQMNGFEFLAEVRRDREVAQADVFMLTSSDAPRDLRMAYEGHVAGFVHKPRSGEGFTRLSALLRSYADVIT